MNPYQHIRRDGAVLQAGHIDTHAKFAQLTRGIDFVGRRVKDVGCNLGEMCHLAKRAGAVEVKGIDKEPAYIADARRLNQDCQFDVGRIERATGNWDIVIASAVLHYCADLDGVLKQLARIGEMLICDVWVDELEHRPILRWDARRRLAYPSIGLWRQLAAEHFRVVENLGRVLSPDESMRYGFQLSLPNRAPAKAVLIYGTGGAGKTSMAKELAAGPGFEHLELDRIFLEWRINFEPSESLSVMDLVDTIWQDDERVSDYIGCHENFIFKWLAARQNLDVVIEGYDAIEPRYREMVHGILKELGWKEVEEISL